MLIVLGSENKAKLRACQMVVDRLFPGASILCIKVPSGVSDQPKSDEETMRGAVNRARAAREAHDADFGIGMEGGYQQIGGQHFECGWMAVIDREGRVGLGTSARFELSQKIHERLEAGLELADVIDEIAGRSDIRNQEGAMGVLTNGHLPRDMAYSHGLLFAFGRFVSDARFWE